MMKFKSSLQIKRFCAPRAIVVTVYTVPTKEGIFVNDFSK
jgi:hypothetical protein